MWPFGKKVMNLIFENVFFVLESVILSMNKRFDRPTSISVSNGTGGAAPRTPLATSYSLDFTSIDLFTCRTARKGLPSLLSAYLPVPSGKPRTQTMRSCIFSPH